MNYQLLNLFPKTNDEACEVELYVDNSLIDTFNNFNNKPMGHKTVSITANATDYKYDLGQCFTFNQVVKVNGVAKTGKLVNNAS